MDIFGILTMVGGLALFLYGMNTMGDGLVMLSGGKLEQVLEKLTKKRIMALLLGASVTAVIQSSSATTVMVVGFVNSGIMKLTQAVGIIMCSCSNRYYLHDDRKGWFQKENDWKHSVRLCGTHVWYGNDEWRSFSLKR